MKKNKKYLVLFLVVILISAIRFITLNSNIQRKYTLEKYDLKAPIVINNTDIKATFNDFKILNNIDGVEKCSEDFKFLVINTKLENLSNKNRDNITFHINFGILGKYEQGVSLEGTIKINEEYKKKLLPKESLDYNIVFEIRKDIDVDNDKCMLIMPKGKNTENNMICQLCNLNK